MNRRTLIASVGTAMSVSLAGCSNDKPATSDEGTPVKPNGNVGERQQADIPYADRYSSVVNLAEAGADTGAGVPIDDVLHGAIDDDTLVFFPPGRYRLDSELQLPSFEHVGMFGRNATIVPRKGQAGYLFAIGRPGKARGFRFEGFTFDFRAAGTGPRAIQARIDDGLIVRDVAVRGRQDTDSGVTRFDVTSKDGTGEVTRLRIPDGGKPTTVSTGCLVGPASTGHITFTDCHIAGFPDNGLYASPATGKVTVQGGTYANSGVANVRVSAPCLVKGVTVRCDRSVEGITNMRGIRIRGGAGAVIRNSTVKFQKVTHSDGAIVLADETGPATLRNTTVQIDTDGIPALLAKSPSSYKGNAKPGIEAQGLTITGSAAEAATVEIFGRPASSLDDICIKQTGANRDGILLHGSGNSRISGSISVPDQRLILQRSPNVRRSLSSVGSDC